MIPSLPKLLALGAVIWAVWMGFRVLERRGGKNGQIPRGDDQTSDGSSDGSSGRPGGHRALDLEECRVCRAWVAAEACERDACPYRANGA